MSSHEGMMQRALELARLAEGRTSPNPMVGAVIVRDGQVLGEGFHEYAGGAHAEVRAIQEAGDCLGATLYVTLEPCCHFGKTPPCTDAVIKSGISEVFYAVPDPNPQVAGKGHRQLELAGIKVQRGPCESEARELNRFFFHYIITGRPFVIAKYVMSMDGKIATTTGESQWITGPESRMAMHQLRNVIDAILVGADTIIADNPQLTTRIPGSACRHPARIILDSSGRIPLSADVFDPGLPGETLVATTESMPEEHRTRLEARGVTVMVLPMNETGRVLLEPMLEELGKRHMVSLIVEGGPQMLGSFLTNGLIQESWAFIGGKMLGGRKAPSPFSGEGIERINHAPLTEINETRIIGNDILIRSTIRKGA